MEQIGGVYVSEIYLLLDANPMIYCMLVLI